MAYTFDKSRIRTAVYRGVRDGLERVAVRFQNQVVRMLSRPGGGARAIRYYTDKKGKRRRSKRYARSLPGQPPAVQTGTLRRSFQRGRSKAVVLGTVAVVKVGSNLKYARWLEEGTSRGLAPRPYVAPVLARFTEARVAAIVNGTIARALREAGLSR